MRLPTINEGQKMREDSREMHERLWAAFKHQGRVVVPVPKDSTRCDELFKLSGRLHKFWGERGYRIRTKALGATVLVWLEEKTERDAQYAGKHQREVQAWTQPRA